MKSEHTVSGNCLQSNRFRYTVYGILFGCCFPIGASVMEVTFDTHGISFSSLINAQLNHPLLWIIDTAPFFLGLFANWIGKRQDNICQLNNILEEKIEGQKEQLVVVNEKLQNQLVELEETRHLYDENVKNLRNKLDQILEVDHDSKVVSLPELIDPKRLQKMQDSFSTAFGVASIIIDIEGNQITAPSNFSRICNKIRETEKGLSSCIKSNVEIGSNAARLQKPSIKKCGNCSLLDAGAPIIVEGRHIATWIVGQSPAGSLNKKSLEKYADEIGVTFVELEDAYAELNRIPLNKFEEIVDLLWSFTTEISSLAFSNLELARELAKKKKISLNESTGIVLEKGNY
jgi:ligand-binding sensor protein